MESRRFFVVAHLKLEAKLKMIWIFLLPRKSMFWTELLTSTKMYVPFRQCCLSIFKHGGVEIPTAAQHSLIWKIHQRNG